MEESKYKYLFPFEKLPPHSKILIYGAGVLGQDYLRQILITGYCEVMGFIDQNYESFPVMIVPLYPPSKISDLAFDYIVVALRDGFALPGIKQILFEQGVKSERIICILERDNTQVNLFCGVKKDSVSVYDKYSSYNDKMTFAIYLAGGYGDMICHKRFLQELVTFVPEVKMVLYTSQHEEYLRWLYSDCPWIDKIELDVGFRYANDKNNHALTLRIYGPKFLIVDAINESKFVSRHSGFLQRLKKLKVVTDNEKITHSTPGAVSFFRHIYCGENCYTWFNHRNVFAISDRNVNIPFSEECHKRFLEFKLSSCSYMTVNCGNGTGQNNTGIAKAWSYTNFCRTVALFKKRYPHMVIVQIGAKEVDEIPGVDYCLRGENFGVVAYVLRDAIFHLDIEGGLVHLASQVGTKCVVLFGPTQKEYFAYPQNINIQVGKCHGCYGLSQITDECIRHMCNPVCMERITPEHVINEIDKYITELRNLS